MKGMGYIFEIKKEHLILLKSAYIVWNDCEYGAPSIYCKKPYGNSDVEKDIAILLGFDEDNISHLTDEDREMCRKYHRETEIALQICLQLGMFEVGLYTREETSNNWQKLYGKL